LRHGDEWWSPLILLFILVKQLTIFSTIGA
jgi:hypothetical protein